MSGARIMVAVPQVRPVIDGVWHMTRLSRFPVPGEPVTTLCGLTEAADYGDQDSQVVATQCWDCDYRYRRDHGMEVLPTHPVLRKRA